MRVKQNIPEQNQTRLEDFTDQILTKGCHQQSLG